MKSSFSVVLITALVLCSQRTFSATYYISNSEGNDQYSAVEAQNPKKPWKTLNKLNSFFNSLTAADSVLFKRGDIFHGSIVITKSGAAFAPIYFGSYGQGKKPEISGLTTLSLWKATGNGIYESFCEDTTNNLIIDGVQQVIGRHPNKGYLSYESHNNNISITDDQLTSSSNWTGAEIVIRKNRWTLDRSLIVSHSGKTINYAPGNQTLPQSGYGYFIQKDPKTLDEFGEWFYDAARKRVMVYFGSKDPLTLSVKISAVNTLVDVRGHHFIKFEDLSFTGAAINAFHLVNAKNITLQHCTINFTGSEAILASNAPYFTIENSFINNSLSGGINLDIGCSYSSIANNVIKNTGLKPGLGKSGSGTYEAITSFGDFTRIEKNNIDSTGYNGIYFGGNSSYAKNNVINYFCLVKDDGAGIYLGDWSKTVNKKVIGNIILNGIGAPEGSNSATLPMAEGIYLDDLTESVTISGNTISRCSNNGIKIHNAKDISVFNNTVYNNGTQLRLEQDKYISTSTPIRNTVIRNNIFFSGTDRQSALKLSSHQDDITIFGELDSNFYCHPGNEIGAISATVVRDNQTLNNLYDLQQWKLAYGKDQSSSKALQTIPTYTVHKLIGENKFSNSNFDENIKNVSWYSEKNDCNASFHNGVLDGGSLKLSFKSSLNSRAIVNMKVGKIVANRKYVLKFTLLGASGDNSLTTFLRRTAAPFTIISEQKISKITSTRTENEFLFSSTADDSDASVIFNIEKPLGDIYIDNVELYEADADVINPDDYLLFAYNANSYDKHIDLDRPYYDVQNNIYSSKINIKPYSSVILLPAKNNTIKVDQTITFTNLENKIFDKTPVLLSAVASSGLSVTYNLLSGPGSINGNILTFNGYGTVIVQAVQPGNYEVEPASTTAQIIYAPPMIAARADISVQPVLKAYPNPFVDNLTVEFKLPDVSGKGTLMLYNLQGKLVHQMYSGAIPAQKSESVTLNANALGLQKGLYIVRLITDKDALYQKVMLE